MQDDAHHRAVQELIAQYEALPRRPRIRFEHAVPDGEAIQPARRWDSKLGGAPYLPQGAAWLMRGDVPWAFLAQVNLGQLEAWRREAGAPQVMDGRLPRAGSLKNSVKCGSSAHG